MSSPLLFEPIGLRGVRAIRLARAWREGSLQREGIARRAMDYPANRKTS